MGYPYPMFCLCGFLGHYYKASVVTRSRRVPKFSGLTIYKDPGFSGPEYFESGSLKGFFQGLLQGFL